MKTMKNVSLILFAFVLIVTGCKDKPLPYEPINHDSGNESLGKRKFLESDTFIDQKAAKFIKHAEDKINLADDKLTKAIDKTGGITTELEAVQLIIDEANDSLAVSKEHNTNLDYAKAISAAKAARELAGEALDMLEDILDAVEDDEEDDDCNEEQAAKFMEQAQEKIDRAQDKVAAVTAPVDLFDVNLTIVAAEDSLALAQIAFEAADFPEACAKAKAAKELAGEALDMLEDILDAVEDDEEDDCNEEQAAKFMEQAQEKIDKAKNKVAAVTAPVDLTDVNLTIVAAEDSLALAQIAIDDEDYPEACAKAKAAKELAGEALDMLEDILDAVEDDEEEDDEEDDNGNEKITICHKGHTTTISINALQAHLNHGDYIGECGD